MSSSTAKYELAHGHVYSFSHVNTGTHDSTFHHSFNQTERSDTSQQCIWIRLFLQNRSRAQGLTFVLVVFMVVIEKKLEQNDVHVVINGGNTSTYYFVCRYEDSNPPANPRPHASRASRCDMVSGWYRRFRLLEPATTRLQSASVDNFESTER